MNQPANRPVGFPSPPSHLLAAGDRSDLPRVLVVDDNLVNLILATEMLALCGVEPLLAGDGAEAVALVCEYGADLILMDLQMPVLDGWAATRQIRRFEREQDRARVPILAYTSNDADLRLLLESGLDGRLGKPCALPALREALQLWCPAANGASAAAP